MDGHVLRQLMCILALMAPLLATPPLWAQQADPIKPQNWDRIGTAVVRFKAERMADGAPRRSALYGSLSDLNVDGAPEFFAFTDPANCVPEECGTTVFGLIGDRYVDLIDAPDAVKHTSVMDVRILGDTRDKYYDVALGNTVLSWNGSRYVDASLLKRGDFDAAGFQGPCAALTDSDYALQANGVDLAQGRAKICGCMAERLAVLGYGKADTTLVVDKYVRQADDNYDNDFDPADETHKVIDQADQTRKACLVQNGWEQWPFMLGEDDEKQPQAPLEFGTFIPTCAGQDWMASDASVGSPDRALAMCACVARKLAGRGYDQAALDGVTKLFAWEITDEELTATHPTAAADSDADLQSCVQALPAR